PLVDQLRRVVAERLADLLLQLAARAPLPAAEQLQQALGRFAPRRVVHVQVTRHDAIPGVADAHHLSRQHASPPARSAGEAPRVIVRGAGARSTPAGGNPPRASPAGAAGRAFPPPRAGSPGTRTAPEPRRVEGVTRRGSGAVAMLLMSAAVEGGPSG